MDFVQQMQKLAGGKVAFATIPVLQEDGWSDDGMQSVVRVDPAQVQDFVSSLLQDQDAGKTEQLAYSPSKTTADVMNDTDVNGLAASVSEGFVAGSVGNNETGRVSNSQIRAAKVDDLGAQAVSKELGNLPIVEDASMAPGAVQVVIASDYTGPGSGLGTEVSAADSTNGSSDTVATAAVQSTDTPLPTPPIITAGSDGPECVN
jgi:hypothetical protein